MLNKSNVSCAGRRLDLQQPAVEVDLTAEQRALLSGQQPRSCLHALRSEVEWRRRRRLTHLWPGLSDSQSDNIRDTNRKHARCQRDLHCLTKKGIGALGTGVQFYIQFIVLLFKVKYFYFSPCQGLFCTCTVTTVATGVLLHLFFLNDKSVFSDMSVFGSELLVCHATFEWTDGSTPSPHHTRNCSCKWVVYIKALLP